MNNIPWELFIVIAIVVTLGLVGAYHDRWDVAAVIVAIGAMTISWRQFLLSQDVISKSEEANKLAREANSQAIKANDFAETAIETARVAPNRHVMLQAAREALQVCNEALDLMNLEEFADARRLLERNRNQYLVELPMELRDQYAVLLMHSAVMRAAKQKVDQVERLQQGIGAFRPAQFVPDLSKLHDEKNNLRQSIQETFGNFIRGED